MVSVLIPSHPPCALYTDHIFQVLVAGPQYLHNGTHLFPSEPSLQLPRYTHLPRYQHVQSSKHHPPNPIPLPRPHLPLRNRRLQTHLHRPHRPPRLCWLQPRLLLPPPLRLDRPPAGHMVGPRSLRAKAHGMGAQGARRPRAPLLGPRLDPLPHGLHPAAPHQQLPHRRVRRQGPRQSLPLQRAGSRFLGQYGGMRVGQGLLGRDVQF